MALRRPPILPALHKFSGSELYRLQTAMRRFAAGKPSKPCASPVRKPRLALFIAAILAAASSWATAIAWAASPAPTRAVIAGARLEANSTLVLSKDTLLRMPGTTKVRADLPAGTRLSRNASARVRAQGKVYEVELWRGARPAASEDGGFGENVAVLAVFPEGERAPTDVAEVQTDRETYLHEKVVPLGQDDAFELVNAHLNAGEDFNEISLFHLRDGRLRRIAQINIGSQRGATCRESFQQRLHWSAEMAASGLPAIVADLETIHAPAEFVQEDCPGSKVRQRSEHARTSYRWDAAKDRYVAEARPPKR
jgi:hypothetical protein